MGSWISGVLMRLVKNDNGINPKFKYFREPGAQNVPRDKDNARKVASIDKRGEMRGIDPTPRDP